MRQPFRVDQSSHGFSVLKALCFDSDNSGKFIKAIDGEHDTRGLVLFAPSVDRFYLMTEGHIYYPSHGLATGFWYVDGTTRGDLTQVDPGSGKPLLDVPDANNIIVLPV